jgi:rare lipoprotein A
MSVAGPSTRIAVIIAATVLSAGAALPAVAAQAGEGRAEADKSASHSSPRGKLDHSGHSRIGKASVYAHRFARRKMADGNRMDPGGANAASKSLPLGTLAKVTNLETGRSAVVTIQDRGPYVQGRIVDLSPGTAREIGLSLQQGVATVEVAPIAVPQPDGNLKPGAGAR